MTLLPETRGTEASQVAFSAFPEPRARLTAQRGTRRLQLSPKYGSGPREVEVSYLWCGAAGAPTVIVQGGISADRDVTALDGDAAPGWWQALVGSGAAIDLERWRVLAIDWLTPDQLGAGSVSSEDQADALAALLRELRHRPGACLRRFLLRRDGGAGFRRTPSAQRRAPVAAGRCPSAAPAQYRAAQRAARHRAAGSGQRPGRRGTGAGTPAGDHHLSRQRRVRPALRRRPGVARGALSFPGRGLSGAPGPPLRRALRRGPFPCAVRVDRPARRAARAGAHAAPP